MAPSVDAIATQSVVWRVRPKFNRPLPAIRHVVLKRVSEYFIPCF